MSEIAITILFRSLVEVNDEKIKKNISYLGQVSELDMRHDQLRIVDNGIFLNFHFEYFSLRETSELIGGSEEVWKKIIESGYSDFVLELTSESNSILEQDFLFKILNEIYKVGEFVCINHNFDVMEIFPNNNQEDFVRINDDILLLSSELVKIVCDKKIYHILGYS